MGFYLGVFLCLGFGLALGSSPAKAALANHVVINEIAVDSVVGSGGTEDDWVELFNPTTQAVVLDGWSIQKSSAAGTSFTRQALAGTIPAGGHFLIVKNDPSTKQALKDAADVLAATTFDLATDNIVFLVNDNLTIANPSDPNIVDMVGYGTVNFYEALPALDIDEAMSISRVPDGDDTDNNLIDFDLIDVPTPQNSQNQSGVNGLSGAVVFTISPDASPVQNLSAISADIVFRMNAAGSARVNYGLTSAYGSVTAAEPVAENTDKAIALSGLACNKTYHYSIYAEDSGATQADATEDATFTTSPCGLTLDSLTMTRQIAKANNKYTDGWEWQFNLTIWNPAETSIRMKFDQWSGATPLPAAANMQFSVDEGATWIEITANNAYSAQSANVATVDASQATGRQVKIFVRMKVPTGTKVGNYTSSYGIMAE